MRYIIAVSPIILFNSQLQYLYYSITPCVTTIAQYFIPYARISRIFSKHRSHSSPTTLTLYSNDKVKSNYFRIITFVSGIQLVLWSYLSYFALFELDKNAPTSTKRSKHSTNARTSSENNTTQPISTSSYFSEKFIERFSSSKWRVILSLLSLGAGVIFATTACMYPLRIVQKLTYVGDSTAAQVRYVHSSGFDKDAGGASWKGDVRDL